MTPPQDPQATCGDDIRLPLADLAVIAGTLSEAASQPAAGIQAPAGPAPGPAGHAADQLSALTEGIASARAMTRGPGIGDRRLRESLTAPLHRAQTRLAALREAPCGRSAPAGA